MSLSSHQSPVMGTDEWLTPPEWIAKLGPFDTDPCSPINRPWPTAARHFTVLDDGLSKEWSGRVWLNPPFGREAIKWLARLADHKSGIALVPARTETRAWFQYVWPRAAAVCFVEGRPHFHRVGGERAAFNSGVPIALIAYTEHDADVLRGSALGRVCELESACLQEPK